MSKAAVTSQGRITIPVEVRKSLNLKAGDKLTFFQTAHGDFLVQKDTGSIMDLKGILNRAGYVPEGFSVSIEEMNQAILDHASELDRATMSNFVERNADDKVA